MNAVHPIVSDLYATAHHQERLAEAEAIRRGTHAGRTVAARLPLARGLATMVGAALVRVGGRLQAASGGEPVPSSGTVR